MPYSTDKPDDLPANVQKMNDDDKAKWVKAYNAAFSKCDGDDCDAEALKAANAAVKKEKSKPNQNIVVQLFESALRAVGYPVADDEPEAPLAAVRAVALNDVFKQVLDQGYEKYPGAWLNDLYEDNGAMFAVFAQDGKLYRSPVTIDNGTATLGEWVQVLVEFADVPGGGEPEAKPPYGDGMYLSKSGRVRTRTNIIRQADGKVRWLSVSCTAVLNRVGEIDSTELFKSFEKNFNARQAGDAPVLRNFFHAGEPFRVGVCDYVAADGYCFITSGLFDDSDIARAEISAREKNPDYWGESIEYTPTSDPVMLRVGDGIAIPTYNAGIFTGVATLPEDKAAALFTTTYQEVIRMLNQDQMTALVSLFGGDEKAAKEWLESNPDALNRMIPKAGLIARSQTPSTAVVLEAGTPASVPAAPATTPTPEAAPVERTVEIDEALVEELTQHILASPALAGLPAALAELTQIVNLLSQNISSRSVTQDKTLKDIGARLGELEKDEGERRATWIQDLPAAAARNPVRTRMTFRPREARTPVAEDGQPLTDSSAIAESTLASAKTRNAR